MNRLAATERLPPWFQERLEQLMSLDRLGHGLLIQGPVGVGKLNFGLVLATRLLGAANQREPLSPAEAVELINLGDDEPLSIHPDLIWLRPPKPGGSIGVDQVRATIAGLSLTSHGGGPKIALLEPAEAMTLAASNALLKTLEEPTRDTYLLLVSHRPGLLPATIVSRCARIPLGPPPRDAALAWLGSWGTLGAADWEQLLDRANRAPWRALRLAVNDFLNINSSLYDELENISKGQLSPLAVAERWAKKDPELHLDWLVGTVEEAIRCCYRPSTRVTDLPESTLHNALGAMTLPALFAALDEARTLRAAVGSGINVEMAMRALLLRFGADPIG